MTARKPASWKSWSDVPEKLRRSVISNLECDMRDSAAQYAAQGEEYTGEFKESAKTFRLALKRLGVLAKTRRR